MMKHVMWPAAVVDKVQYHAKERERTVTTNFCFVLACSGYCSVVAWTQVTGSSAQFLHLPSALLEPSLVSEQQLACGKPNKEAACALPLASQTGYIFHLSTGKQVWLICMTSLWQRRAVKMMDATKAITGQFFKNDCKHSARQKARSFVRVNEAITTRGMQTASLQNYSSLVWSASQLSYSGLSRPVWLCLQSRRAGGTCMAQTDAQGLICMTNKFSGCSAGPSTTPPCLNYKGPKDRPFRGAESNPAQVLQE